MVFTVKGAGILGVDAFCVDIEVSLTKQGMPSFNMVGLPATAVREAQDRVITGLRTVGYTLPPAKIVVNFAPADKKKTGTAYDLPLAVGLLGAMGIFENSLEKSCFVGELSLSGDIKGVAGVLSMVLMAKQQGFTQFFLPYENLKEASIVEGIELYPLHHLTEIVNFLQGTTPLECATNTGIDRVKTTATYLYDFSEVKGQEHAKRAVEIAAAGQHNILFVGPPGSGKTMLAQRIPSILPPLTTEEMLSVTKIYSIMRMLDEDGIVTTRPFRSPHHTITEIGLIGGGVYPKPGEVSLAHCGVLFLDELLEFNKHTLEVLRQPIESGKVLIARASASIIFPARFMLVAAMNPCPCGYRTDPAHTCTCTSLSVQRYKSKLSGPLLDRIDLHIEVPPVPYTDLTQGLSPITSSVMRENILQARKIQEKRFEGTHYSSNSELNGTLLEKACLLGKEEKIFLENAVARLSLSARAHTRILRIARTIADLTESTSIEVPHLAEAIGYRTLDRGMW